jgi:Glutaminase
MKTLLPIIFCLFIFSCSPKDIQTIKFKDGEGLKLTKIGSFNNSFLLVFPYSPRIYNIDSTDTKFRDITQKYIKSISFDSETHEILDFTFQTTNNTSNNIIPPCNPESITAPQDYSKDSILKYFQEVKAISSIKWDSQDSCSFRAHEVSLYLKGKNVTSYKAFALPSPQGICYSMNSSQGIPKWRFHVASSIFCSDDNTYYIFDLFFDKNNPIKYVKWQDTLNNKVDDNCESFDIYASSCRANGPQILCSCPEIDK